MSVREEFLIHMTVCKKLKTELAPSAGSAEYTDCFSAERLTQRVSWI